MNLFLSLLKVVTDLWSSLKKKPEPEKVPEPVDTKKAKDLLNPEEK